MGRLISFIGLIRPLNLLIIAVTMVLMRYFVVKPMVTVNGFELQFSFLLFGLLVISTLLIAAAGNIINDYTDEPIDRINKPGKSLMGAGVNKKTAMVLYQVFNVAGLGLALFVAWKAGNWKLSIISFFAAGSLWFYSLQFKKEGIAGNLIIAVLCALVPLLVGVYEIPLLIKKYGAEVAAAYAKNLPGVNPSEYFQVMFYFILAYAGFAFILTLIREIQKDAADVEGDRRGGARTLAVTRGIKVSKIVAVSLIGVTVLTLAYVRQKYISDPISLFYLAIAVALPLILSAITTFKARERKGFLRASKLTKLTMAGGVLYSVVHYLVYYANT